MDKIIKVIQEEKRFFSLFPDYEIISEKVDDVHVEAEYRVRLDNLRWLLKFAPKNIREQMFPCKVFHCTLRNIFPISFKTI